MIVNRAEGALHFRVDGRLPSRERLHAEREEGSWRAWSRMLELQDKIGRLARDAAAPEQLVGMFGKPVGVEITYYGQLVDLSNCEILIDALKGICYPDDRARFVKRVELVDGGSVGPLGEEEPHVWMRVGPGLT